MLQVKIARVEAFQQTLREELLLPLSDSALATDSYLMHLWCILSAMRFPSRPGCLHLRHVSVIHFDTRSIVKTGQAKSYFSKISESTVELYRRHAWAWDHFRWNLTTRPVCWSLIDETAPGVPLAEESEDRARGDMARGLDKFGQDRIPFNAADPVLAQSFSGNLSQLLRQHDARRRGGAG